MRAILRALHFFGEQIGGQAIIFFVDNTHSLGCLLKRSASLEGESHSLGCLLKRGASWEGESATSRFAQTNTAICPPYGVRPLLDFEKLSESIKLSMDSLARDVWSAIAEYDLLVWWEYVNTHSNAADLQSWRFWPHCGGFR